MIISLVRANATGSVGFTDDAKRLNVAIARARAGVTIVGHLATIPWQRARQESPLFSMTCASKGQSSNMHAQERNTR